MDKICKFLCFDFCDLLSDLLGCSEDEKSDENKNATTATSHKYPKRLITYDAEAVGEPRLIRYSDLTESVTDLLLSTSEHKDCQVKKEDEDEEEVKEEHLYHMAQRCEAKKSKCRKRQSKKSNSKMAQKNVKAARKTCKMVQKPCKRARKTCKASQKESKMAKCKLENDPKVEREFRKKLKWAELNRLLTTAFEALCPGEELSEQRVKLLEACAIRKHQRFVKSQADNGTPLSPALSTWECLLPMQKFRYYWEALTQHALQPTPYANFREVFIRRYRRVYGDTHNLWSKVFRCWRVQKCSEQLPFILNALLYQISIGTVDPYDACSIRELINLWSRQNLPATGKGSIQMCLSRCQK